MAEPYAITSPCVGTKDMGCVDVCPGDAIFPGDRVPESEAEFIDINHYVFADITA